MKITIHPPSSESLPASEFLSDTQLLIIIYGDDLKVVKALFVDEKNELSFDLREGEYNVLFADVRRGVFVHGRISQLDTEIYLIWKDKWILETGEPGGIGDITVKVKIGPTIQYTTVYLTDPDGVVSQKNTTSNAPEAVFDNLTKSGWYTVRATVSNGETITAAKDVAAGPGWSTTLCSDHTTPAAPTAGHIKVQVRVDGNIKNNKPVILTDSNSNTHSLTTPVDYIITNPGVHTVFAEAVAGGENVTVETNVSAGAGWSPTICIKHL